MIQDFPRALTILEMALDGITLNECGAKFGITGGRCQQLIRWTARILAHKSGEPVPEYYTLSEMRQQADYWRRQIATARS